MIAKTISSSVDIIHYEEAGSIYFFPTNLKTKVNITLNSQKTVENYE
jgi:hypothetical protein